MALFSLRQPCLVQGHLSLCPLLCDDWRFLCLAPLLSQLTPHHPTITCLRDGHSQLRDAVQHMAMFSEYAPITKDSHITPPSSFATHPLTPPPTDEKPFAQAHRVIALFKEIRAGKHTKRNPWTEFQLSAEEYDEIERRLRRDEDLSGYVNDKIRYDYNSETHRLVVRMPTGVHELFIDGVEDAIRSQLKAIRRGSDKAARFAQKVWPARSTEIEFPVEDCPTGRRSKYEPDASFWHENAQYPGVIIEVAYSQKKKRLGQLAEDYLLDSDANVRVVVGLDIEYGKKGSHVLRVVQEAANEIFRDEQGIATDHPGLQLHLSDFAHKGLVQEEMGNPDRELNISARQLCKFLNAAEVKVRQKGSLSKDLLPVGVKKRKRSETPPEEIASTDEARYVEQEERAAKRIAEGDSDYEDISAKSPGSCSDRS
ncbi:uncharacterized protein BDR25DRAFT_336652 [Lindgomyces ingoldianus]|uniref:Uncharacterized protein n=1 Tax=Lindgomyces ingoldianus TaxID=673940 RepID=A0ACB6QIY8_9PLEO|nr:uncharacterized protein BDR25DRAFT_336652 [Lindgomyces ingoldianus]KAF2466100.1 hypothetical protein BDR25DRAFT_336652 [Lindgomyces ingoldianus]